MRTQGPSPIAAALAALLLGAGAVHAQDETARELFERGYYRENAARDLDAAIEAYREVAETAEDRELAGRARVRLALCEQARGRAAKARELLEGVLEDFADVPAVREEAQEHLASAGGVRRSLRLHDVEFLTRRMRDDPAPGGDLWPGRVTDEGRGAGGVFSFSGGGAAPEGMRLEPDQLVDLITQNIAEDSWQNARNSIRVRNGRLLVVQTADVHAEVARYLEQLRRLRGRLVAFDVRVVLVEGEVLRETLAGTDGGVLSEDGDDALSARWREGEGARVIERHRVTAFDRQRVSVSALREYRYSGRYDVDETGVVPLANAEVEVGREGLALELRPVLVGDGGHVLLAADGTLSDWTHTDRSVQVGDPETPKEATLQLPTADVFRLQTGLLVPAGRTVLLGAVRTERFAWEERWEDPRLAVLVRPTLNALDAGADWATGGSSGRRETRLYNVSLLTEGLDPIADTGDGGGPVTFGAAAEEPPAPLETDTVVDMVRENVRPDSWNNDLNRLEVFSDGALLAVQTPAVHAQLASFLRTLRRSRGQVLHVEAFRFDLPPGRVDALLADASPAAGGGFSLPESALAELLAETGPDGWAGVTCGDGRRASLVESELQRYVKDYAQTVGGTGFEIGRVIIPRVARTRAGTELAVRPQLLPDGRHVSVELQLELSSVQKTREVATPHGTVELPSRAARRYAAHLTFPRERVLLVGASVGAAEGPGRGVVLLRVRAADLLGGDSDDDE